VANGRSLRVVRLMAAAGYGVSGLLALWQVFSRF
jgi:hypothetical protein